MRGIQFGEYHTAEDWGLILNSKTLTPPTPKTKYVAIEGRDGDLDLSEALTGEITYENRIASFTFLLTEGSYEDREQLVSEILSNIHGKRLNMILPDNPDHYLDGRCSVTNTTNDKGFGSIIVEANCDPWFYASIETSRIVTVDNSTIDILLSNQGVKTVVPEIMVEGDVTLKFNESNVALSSGTYKLPKLRVKRGTTPITIEGTGTITFTYREGVL